MASKTGASPTAKHRIESLKKAKNDLSTHHSYVISMSMKSVKQSPKMSREVQPQQATQTAQIPTEAKDGDSQKNDNQKGESWFGVLRMRWGWWGRRWTTARLGCCHLCPTVHSLLDYITLHEGGDGEAFTREWNDRLIVSENQFSLSHWLSLIK